MNIYFILLCILANTSILYSQHTEIYNQYKSGTFTKTLFLPNTYIGVEDPCAPIDRNSFIKRLEDIGIMCSGDWCDSDGGYGCDRGNTVDCYNMEHIIDQKNSDPEFGDSFDKKILGNVIMAYSVWNSAVGNIGPSTDKTLKWETIKNEKREIYGATIFDRAAENVRYCSRSISPTPIEDDSSDEPPRNYTYYILGGTVFVLLSILTLSVIYAVLIGRGIDLYHFVVEGSEHSDRSDRSEKDNNTSEGNIQNDV